ncbi:hypothetical protein RugamoR64_39770 [Duganella rhizosphaerae]|uniref:hypothetical protein n=1 Tax=Duganella rhizosphaerae TaxID=2885763 RepID=UPI0030E9DECE
MANITQFPGRAERRNRQNLKNGIVACQVSDRWLQFPDGASDVGGKGFMQVDVMTRGSDEQPKKLCELVLAKEDLLAMLAKIETEV